MEGCRLDLSGSEKGPMEGSCEHGNEPSGSMKYWAFLEWVSNCWLLKEDSAPYTDEGFCNLSRPLQTNVGIVP
jgi:hypothetical protein